MQIASNLNELQAFLSKARAASATLGFVPTMGALHEGHASLVDKSLKDNDLTVVSVFVNPTQFGPNEDFSKYPRTLDSDAALCASLGAHLLYAPRVGDIYPEGVSEVGLHVKSLDTMLDGASRPGHFNGVMQVVAKLLHQVQPHRAYFGLKDYQQITIIRAMARELFFPVEIVGCPIVREADGLAMSSRNRYLGAEERRQALYLSQTLLEMRRIAASGGSLEQALAVAGEKLPLYPLIRLDYCEIRSAALAPVSTLSPADEPVALIAAWCGTTRLIDNMLLFS